MIYKSIVGSRSYGLDLSSSDTDIAVVFTKRQREMYSRKHGCDAFLWTPDELAVLQKGSRRRWVDCTMLFPHEFCIENGLSNWIVEHREEMVKSMLPDIYGVYMSACKDFIRNPDHNNKWVMYAIHFRNMLANYAEGMTFAEALKPQGAYRTFLLSVRNGIAPKELVIEANAKARERAKEVAGFYAEPKADLAILNEFKHMVYKEVEELKK